MARAGSSHGKRGIGAPSVKSAAPSDSARSSPTRAFGAAMMEENISMAEDILAHWDQEGSSSTRQLHRFLRAISDLQRARKFFVNDSSAISDSSDVLIRSQTVMQKAASSLQREFHRILNAQRDTLSSESLFSGSRSSISLSSSYSSLGDLENEDSYPSTSGDEVSDLRSIAECMIYCGHGKECIDIYRLVRRSVVEEGLYKLGFDRMSASNVQKLDWALLENRIWNWVAGAKAAVRVLFAGERVLCGQIFSSSVGEALFAEVASEAAKRFFTFPHLLGSKVKLSPEKIFRFLDMYETMLDLLPEIESVFSYQSTAAVRAQVDASLLKVGEAVRFLFEELESAIQKENSKAAIPGGGLHPLARYVANYVSLLADYGTALEDIYAEQPFEMPAESSFPAAGFMSAPPSPPPWEGGGVPFSTVSLRLKRILFLLICKLDSKAELYGEPALGYLFLANNLRYLVTKVQRCKLADTLGEEWTAAHSAKARRYAASYERLAWKEAMETIPGDLNLISEMETETAVHTMRRFNEAFDSACRRQAGWVVPDRKMEEELKLSIAGKLISAYRPLYVRCRGGGRLGRAIRFAPEDLAHYIADLFCDNGGSSVSSCRGSSAGVSTRRGKVNYSH